MLYLKTVHHLLNRNQHISDAENIDIVMSIYNLTEYSNNYSVLSKHLCQFIRDESTVPNDESPVYVTAKTQYHLDLNQVL